MTLSAAMIEALKLTREGKLGDATRMLREMSGSFANHTAAPAPAAEPLRASSPQLPHAAPPSHKAPQPTRSRANGFVARNHGAAGARMAYKLYVPADLPAGSPLVVMLHGCTQSPDDFARGTGMNALADELGFAVAYPEQTRSANAQKCWNWFVPGHQQRDRGEPALIAGLTRDIIAELAIDPKRVFVAGLSAGGAAAAIMAEAYPDLYAAVGVHSGLACGAARDLPSALNAMRSGAGAGRSRSGGVVPTIVFHGDRDQTVHVANAEQLVTRAAGSGGQGRDQHSETGTSASGQRYTRTLVRDTDGRVVSEQWTLHGGGHAWAGGSTAGSYTDPAGPDASREMLRFFLEQAAFR